MVWLTLAWASLAQSADHAVVLLYHHVSEQTPPSTSVSPATFREQLDFLQQQDYTVLHLHEMLDTLYAGKSLPDRAVAITFDDAYESVLKEAAPMLEERGMPFTVLIPTEGVDRGYAGFMSWQQMRRLPASLASFGAHSVTHPQMVARLPGETETAWRARVTGEIRQSIARIETMLGTEVRSFAYPYGEYSAELGRMVADEGLYGLAQQSGAVGPGVHRWELPRFPIAGGFVDRERFQVAVDARPLPVPRESAASTVVQPGQSPTDFLLEPGPGNYEPDQLGCYSSRGERLAIDRTGGGYRVALPEFSPGRNKINCTAPVPGAPGEFYWYSRLWIVTDTRGEWLKD